MSEMKRSCFANTCVDMRRVIMEPCRDIRKIVFKMSSEAGFEERPITGKNMHPQLIEFCELLMGLTKMLSILASKIMRVSLSTLKFPECVNVREDGLEWKKEWMERSGWG